MKAHEFAKAFASLPEDAEVIVSSGRLSVLHNGKSFPVIDVSQSEQNVSFPNKIGRAVSAVQDWAKPTEETKAETLRPGYQLAEDQTPITTDPAPETA